MNRVTLARSTYSSVGLHTIATTAVLRSLGFLGTLVGAVAKTIQEPLVQGSPQPPPRRPPSMGAKAIVGIFAVLSLIVAAGAAYGFGFYKWANGKFHRIHVT